MDQFVRRREWLTLLEAASELSSSLERSVDAADLLRLALDGHLQLSVNIAPGGPAWRCRTEERNAGGSQGRSAS
jgi:hypothetical protein